MPAPAQLDDLLARIVAFLERIGIPVAFAPLGAKTRMTFTEQLAFLGDAEARRARVAGTETGFDRLLEVVVRDIAGVH